VLTKPLGNGVLFNANRARKFPYAELEREVLPVTAALNKAACEAALKYEIHAMTDITGFGIAGHALEMALGSKVRLALSFAALPLYPGTVEMYAAGVSTGSNAGNRALCGGNLTLVVKLKPEQEEALFDPQTSGGLLASLPAAQAREYVRDLHAAGVPWAAVVGTAESGEPGVSVTG
jgi:selenide,water dikinase